MNQQPFLTEQLCRYYDDPNLTITLSSASGGDIHQSYMIQLVSDSCAPDSLFVKLNHADNSAVLAAESQALEYFQQSVMAGYYPKPILFDDGVSALKQNHCMLIMEYCDLAPVSFDNAAALGSSLAKQHSIQADRFGWASDNFIGTTPQTNQWNDSWVAFFAEQRLAPQLAFAASRGLNKFTVSLTQSVIGNLAACFDTVTEAAAIKPSLLHGDLWSGNLAVRRLTSEPLVYDPAPYFGDPEVDVAMTKLFGQLPDSFYAAYHRVYPVLEGHAKRAKIYDLYHLLNHFNLFGESYEPAVSSLVQEVLNEL